MTHAIHKRLSSPTVVEHCVKATFISPNQINLIVGRTTVLQIYALRKPSKAKDDPKHSIARLDLIREFQLFGNVQALGVVRLPDKMTDSLVLGFPDAKISIVEWNPAIDDLEITGLHFYENEEQLKEGHSRVVNKPQLVVSQDSKCAVMLSYERQLIVVPFRPESAHLDHNVIYSDQDIARKYPSTYVVHLPSIGVLHVKDMTFLEGYYEPTLLILYEPFQTYGTRLPSRKNTACITALSLNINKKTNPVVWSKCNLPYDAYSIIPVPLPIGGVIVMGANSIFYFNQTTDYGMTFNHFGDTQGSPYRTEKSDIVLVLDNACGTWLNADSLLLTVDGGDLYLLRLYTDGRTVTRFTIENKSMIEKRAYNVREEVPIEEKISPGTIASCMCTLSEEFIFIGSHMGDSILVQYREKIIPIVKEENNGEGGGNINGERPSKRTKLNHNGDDPTVKQEEERPLDKQQKPHEVDRIRKFENDGLREDPNENSQNKKLEGIPENGEATDDPWKDLESSIETDEDRKLINVFRESYQRRNWESRHKKKDYEFEICDILPNIGPIVDITIQPSLDDATVSTIEETDEKIFNTKSRRKVELVCCSGRGKNGALTIIQRGVRPEINTSVEVPGCRALWGVFHRRTDENVRGAEDEILWTRYLVLSRDDRTMVLETGDIIQEISNKVEFFTDGPTQNVGNLFNNHRIAQVHSNGVILLDGVMRTQEWTVPSPEFTVIASSIKDPYVLLQLNNRSLILLEAVVKQSDFNLVNTGITFDNQSPVSAFYLFRDESCCPIFNTTKEEAENRQHRVKLSKRKRQSTSTTTTAPLSTPLATASTVAKMISGIAELPGLKNKVEDPFSHAMNNDPEELEIYGYNNIPGTPDFYTDETIPPDNIVRPFYCALTLDDGTIQIYRFVKPDNTDAYKGKGQTGEDDQNQELEREALSSVERVFHASRFSDGPSLISDESLDYIEAIDVGSGRNKKRHNIFAVELGLFSMGSHHLPPNLFAFLNNGDLLVYQCFFYASKHKDSIPLRLRRIEQNMLFRNFKRPIRKIKKEKKSKKKKNNEKTDEESSDAEVEEWVDENPNFAILSTANDYRPTDIRYSRMVSFDNIADRRGIFIVGIRPIWVFCERDSLRFHPMTVDGRINSFTPFHNVSNRRGFIYYTETQSRMKICQLNPLWEMELSCPFRKLPLGSTITHITYDAATQLLIVVTEKPVKDRKLYYQPEIVANEDLEKPLPEEEIMSKPLPERLPELTQDQFQMHLLSPENWTILDTFHFHKEERVLSAKICNLNVKQNEKTVSQAFLAVGTAYVRGEDLGAQGRILVFAILRPRDVTQSKFELLFEKSERGPISCVAQLDGLLLCAIGMKILLFQFSDRKSLVGVAFFDCQILIVDAVSIKNYVILGDMYKSIYFLRWKDRARQLELLAKDYDPLNVLATQFLVDDKTVTFLVCDTEMNVHMFSYAPRDKESRGGQKLLCSGNFYLGSSVNRFLRLRMNHLRTNTKIPVNKHCALYTTLDGGIGYIAPIEKEKFEKLGRLEMRMVSALQHVAGLNPKAFRLTKPWLKMSHNHQRSVIDGELLWRFAFMERQKQDELADSVGTTTEEVIDFLMEIDACTSFF